MSEPDDPAKGMAQMREEILDFFEQSFKRQIAQAEETQIQLSAFREALENMGDDEDVSNKESGELRNSLDSLKEAYKKIEAQLKLRTDDLEESRQELARQKAEITDLKRSNVNLRKRLKVELAAKKAPASSQGTAAKPAAAPAKPQDEFAELNEAVRKNPKNIRALRQLALAYSSRQRFQDAIPPLLTAVKINPKDAEMQFLLGHTFFKVKKFEASLPHLYQAVRLNPKLAKAHYDLCIVNELVGQEEAASMHYNIALKLDPNIESSM